jgi:thiol-disulfide isomerase/thioredoxin
LPKIGEAAPNLHISTWVQGRPTNIDQEKGNVVLVEVFQVNCPGCFLYGIPDVIEIYNKHRGDGLTILGVATAFEDFDKNNVDNLQKLLITGEVTGETYNALHKYGWIKNGNKLPYKIPFPVGMDLLSKTKSSYSDGDVTDFIEKNMPEYRSYPEKDRAIIRERARHILSTRLFTAKTFEEYSLRGTPSTILVDRKGILRNIFFGANGGLSNIVDSLLSE